MPGEEEARRVRVTPVHCPVEGTHSLVWLGMVQIVWYGTDDMLCTVYPKSLLFGLKQVQTQLLSFYVSLIHKNPKELNPKIGGFLRYRLHRVVKSL